MSAALHLDPSLMAVAELEATRQCRTVGDVTHQAIAIGLQWMAREKILFECSTVPMNFGPKHSLSRRVLQAARHVIIGDCAVFNIADLERWLGGEKKEYQRVLIDMHVAGRAINSDGIVCISSAVLDAYHAYANPPTQTEAVKRAKHRERQKLYEDRRRLKRGALTKAQINAAWAEKRDKRKQEAKLRCDARAENKAAKAQAVAERAGAKVQAKDDKVKVLAALKAVSDAVQLDLSRQRQFAREARREARKDKKISNPPVKLRGRAGTIMIDEVYEPPNEMSKTEFAFHVNRRGSRDILIERDLKSKVIARRRRALNILADIADQAKRASDITELALTHLRRKGCYAGRMKIYNACNPNFYVDGAKNISADSLIARAVAKGFNPLAAKEISA